MFKNQINYIVRKDIVFWLLILFSIAFAFYPGTLKNNFFISINLLLVGMLSLIGLFKIRVKQIRLSISIYIFYYFFFFIAPIVQYKNAVFFHTKSVLKDEYYFNASLLVLATLFMFICIDLFLKNKQSKPLFFLNENSFSFRLAFSISFFSTLLYLYLIKFNLKLLVFRPFDYSLKENTNWGSIGYGLLLFVRQIPFVVFFKSILKKSKINQQQMILFLFVLLISFPTSLPRGLAAVIYIPILLTFFPVFKHRTVFVFIFFIGLLVVFPLMNCARDWNEGSFSFNYELFTTGHFDAFQNLAYLLKENIITNGAQLKGNMLFFLSNINNIPNVGSGHLVGAKVGFSYLNVAMPFIGEGYVNFGYVGVFLFVLVLSSFNFLLESLNSIYKSRSEIKLLYLMMFGYEFYLMRGDLRSSIKMLVSFLLAILVVNLCINLNKLCAKNG